MKIYQIIVLLFACMFLLSNCKKDEPLTEGPSINTYTPTPYELTTPHGFPDLIIPADNPLTVEGVQLGRMLFYDSIIDINSDRACASCHLQSSSFSSPDGNSSVHMNFGWNTNFLWPGKVEGTIEDIMLFEVEEFFLTDVDKLNNDSTYPTLFKNAFGAESITSKEVAYALAQFERSLISSNSKWDKYLRGEATLTAAEERGSELFYNEKGDCFHCHGTIKFTDNLFHNNGLDSSPEQGREEITGDSEDFGKFKTPTLRNIELTAPYMHDARYNTLIEVLDFYSEKVKWSTTIDPLMKIKAPLDLQQKFDIIAFLKTLTDTTFINNPEHSDPF